MVRCRNLINCVQMRQLEDHELQQTAFLALVEHYAKRLSNLRLSLEGNLDAEQTQAVRIQIRECKAFLAFNPKYTAD
jgi:hypothetical protein